MERKGQRSPNVISVDLVFANGERPHRVFTREGSDHVTMQMLSLAEAARSDCTGQGDNKQLHGIYPNRFSSI